MKLRSSIAQLLLQQLNLFLLLVILVSANKLSGQTIDMAGPKSAAEKDSTNLEAKGLPPLVPLSGDTIIKPYYSYLWIFGDGNFINGTLDSTVKHRYEVKLGTIDTFEVRAYSTDTYSGGDPPPMLQNGDIIINPSFVDTVRYRPSTAVEEGFLHLQRNHEIRPEDTLVNILSFKNNTDSEPLTGQLYLFYNSPVTRKAPKNAKGKFRSSVSSEFSKFNFEESLIYYNNVDNNTYSINNIPTQLGQSFEKALVFNYSGLNPRDEQHLFIAFDNDSTLVDLMDGNAVNEVQFMAVMTAFTQGDGFLDQEEATRLNEIGLFGFMDTLAQSGGAGSNGPFIEDFQGDLATTIIDAFDMTAALVREHDPNQIRVDACECPDENGVHKLVFTVDCENNGSAITKNIFIDIEIPEELDFNSIHDTLISHHPEIAEGTAGKIELSKDEATRTIRWSMLNFGLLPTQEMGFGHPSTQAQIVFTAITNPGVPLGSLPQFRACIRFIDDPDEEVCTMPVKVSTIKAENSTQILQCEDCSMPELDTTITGDDTFMWIFILLALILAFILYLLRRFFGGTTSNE